LFNSENIVLRPPNLKDGIAVFELVKNCPPLDTNSSYCNLLQCSHFASTSVAAEHEGQLAGFISGYIIPDRPNTLFVWQVAVSEQARGAGLASCMLKNLLERANCENITHIETSITQDNQASWALFKGLAKKLATNLQSLEWMDKDIHFAGRHNSEALVRIGPITLLTK
jgi:L-2,4-diaminobutyric acid acetyltransferase